MDEAQIRRAAQDALRTYGPMHSTDLSRRLSTSDDSHVGDDGPDPDWVRSVLLDDRDTDVFSAFPLADGRLCDLDALLGELTLTHVLTDQERASDTLELDPDLAILHVLSPDGRTVPLDDGRTATYTDGADALAVPDDWLPAEPVLAVRVVDGRVGRSGLTTVPPVDDVVVDRLARTFAVTRDHLHAVDVVDLLIEARARYPQLLGDAHAPVRDLLAAAELRSIDHEVLRDDEPDPTTDIEDLVEHLRLDHRFDAVEAATVVGVLEDVEYLATHVLRATLERLSHLSKRIDLDDLAIERAAPEFVEAMATAMSAIDIEEAGDRLTVALTGTELTAAIVEDVIGSERMNANTILALLDASGVQLPTPSSRANAAWLRARALEVVADDHTEAERELRRAVELDDDHAPAVFELACYLADRGQAGAALGLLHRLEGPDVDALTSLLSPYVQPGPASAGRNDPCPCGSGRKHKVCCQQHGGWPLQERIDWVWRKVVRFAVSSRAEEITAPIARAAGMDPDANALEDVAVGNLALFEGGLLELLCDLRGGLLPADELDMLREWSRTRGRIYELIETRPGGEVTILDLANGERVHFVDHSLARGLTAGTAMLAWLVPEPDGPVPCNGGVRIPDHLREHALHMLDQEPSAVELAAWYASLAAPPQLATTAGDPLLATTQVYEAPDVEAARRSLAEHLEEEGDDGALLAFEDREGERWLKGSVAFDGATFTVSTMSAVRARWFADLIAEVVPEARLIDEQRLPAGEGGDPGDPQGGGAGDPFPDLDTLSDEDREALEAHLDARMEEYEVQWLDLEVPMLGGATPREAAEDPTRRDDLRRLLEQIEARAEAWSSAGRPMDAARLRSLLGM